MQEAIKHLRAALSLLIPQRDDAGNRFDRYDKRRRGHSSGAARQAWTEYRVCGEMIDLIKPSTQLTNSNKNWEMMIWQR